MNDLGNLERGTVASLGGGRRVRRERTEGVLRVQPARLGGGDAEFPMGAVNGAGPQGRWGMGATAGEGQLSPENKGSLELSPAAPRVTA